MSTRGKQLRIAVVIPAYNEGATVNGVIRGLGKVLRSYPYTPDFIVVDDGSKDDTAQKAELAGAHVIKHILNTGSGGATATGLSYAQQEGYDMAVTVDADGQHDPLDVLDGIRTLVDKNVDLLIGSRLINEGDMSKVKRFGNKALSFMTYMLFGVKVTDSQSGLRVFSQKALCDLKWKTSGYEFCSEMLWRAKQANLSIDEFPAKAIYTEYSRSKGQNNWNGVNIAKTLLMRRITEFFGE
jgi:glycosyltransferase involved in cell wall biosynthesis